MFLVKPNFKVPILCCSSIMASLGQTMVQPPQLWHNSGKKTTFFSLTNRALYWQKSAHFPQWSHNSSFTTGTETYTGLVLFILGCRRRWALGSSTSQSRNWTSPTETAMLAATEVFPVPPFPLATATIIQFIFLAV